MRIKAQSCVSCSYSDSVEREETLEDNTVQLQSFVQYEPDLFVSRYVCVCVFVFKHNTVFIYY